MFDMCVSFCIAVYRQLYDQHHREKLGIVDVRRIRFVFVEMSQPDDVNEVVDSMNISQAYN